MSSFDWSNSKTFNQNSRNREKLSDSVAIVDYPSKGYGAYRFLTNPRGTALHWISTLAKSKPGEKKQKINNFPKVCLGFDPETMEIHAEKCPYCTDLELNPRVELRVNVIDRKLQENEPRKPAPPTKKERKLVEWNGGKWHVKDGKEGGGWTPVRVLTVSPAIGNSITEITSLNKHKNKKSGERKAFGPDHPRYGYDVMVKYDKDAAPAKMYTVQKGDVTAITDEEKGYLIWDIPEHAPEDLATAKKEAKRMKPYVCNRDGELLFPDAEGDGKKAKKNRYKDKFDSDEDLEDNEDEDEDDDEDTDEDDRRSKKSKKSKSKKWDEDDDDDDDDDDDSDEDEDEDDEDEDEDEDERPSKKSKSSKSKSTSKSKSKSKKSRDDDDDDDDAPWDEDEDEDEDDDEPKSKKSKSTKSKGKMSVKTKSRKNAKVKPRFKSKFKA